MAGVEKVVERVNVVLRRELDILHRQLIESGLDEDKVDEAFGAYSNPTAKKYGAVKRTGSIDIVLDYGPKTHAIFGDDKTIKSVVVGVTWIRYNRDLLYGSGYLIRDKSKLPELEKMFSDKNITFSKITKKKYEAVKTASPPPVVGNETDNGLQDS